MNFYPQTVRIPSLPYRFWLALSALVGVASLAAGDHVLLTLATHTCVIISGVVAWLHPQTTASTRQPLLLALALLVPQAILYVASTWINSAWLLVLANPGITALIVACLVVAMVGLSVPNERHLHRAGARATRLDQRYRVLLLGGALGAWVLMLLSAGIAGSGAGIQAAYLVVLGLLVLVSLPMLWHTWRTRRHDHLLLSTAGAAGGLVLAQASAEIIPALAGQAPIARELHILPLAALGLLLVAAHAMVLRRPIPTVPPRRSKAQPASEQAQQPSLLKDYISLTKPKVISLLLLTTLAAMFITGEGMPSLALVFWTMVGGYLAAGGAGAINCAFDRDIDLYMGRTSRRPVPSGRISQQQAFGFGVALSVLSGVVFFVFTTPLAAVLALLGIVYYAFFYTRLLKKATWQNIVIGGGAGALPPLVGWAAVTGSLNLPAVILFMIVFYWTPPHFWALALVKEKDYARAGVPMLPVVAGERETRWQILLYSLLLVAITLLLAPLQAMGLLYLVLALVLGGVFLRYAWNVWHTGGQTHIWGLYKYSLLYLALLFSAMVLDRVLLA
jgi:protoheme IX farnesyltransferase